MSAAAAVAAARRRRMLLLQEEEEMTAYGPDDLNQHWEFKIVRANTAAFRNPANLQRLLQEEAQAGWSMVEKFDNSRIRLKRPQFARLNDPTLPPGVDPYRVHYGMPPVAFALLLMMVILGGTAVIVARIFLFVNGIVR